MTNASDEYRDRVYAGWLGKCIGVRLGAPLESWTYQEIAGHLGEVTDFLPLPPGKIFKPDDDTAVPLVLIRALEDFGPPITAAKVGETLLNYLGDQRGTLWWGGYGVSTEHTAYLNLAAGIPAPRSGSISQNGKALAEQIGGQIFSDVWGLVLPNDPVRAADYAQAASSATHDGEGLCGARFVAGLVSQAFSVADPAVLVEGGLGLIPPESEYARVTRAVQDFHRQHPADWRGCYEFIASNFGYDRYQGMVPIIPNAAVVVMALLYSGGDFSAAVRIATMAGWDTDCNAGNVGAIMGVAVGLAGIDPTWRAAMNDVLVAASVIGGRNALDIPACADLFSRLGQAAAMANQPVPPGARLPRYHFDYPGATHGFTGLGSAVAWRQVAGQAQTGRGALQVSVRQLTKKGEMRVMVKTYHRPAELSANYYGASFSPTIYPGQTLMARVWLPADAPPNLVASLYVWDDNQQMNHQAAGQTLAPGEWQNLTYTIPALNNALLSKTGLVIRNVGEAWSGHLLLDSLDWEGPAQWACDFSRERPEYGAISQWTHLRGYWRLEDGGYHGSGPGINESYTGDIGWRDLTLTVDCLPLLGEHHNINIRVQGARRSYAVGLAPGGRLVIYKNEGGYRVVAETAAAWQMGQRCQLRVEAAGPELAVALDGQPRLRWTDPDRPYLHGQIGLSNFKGCHTRYVQLAVAGRA